MWEGTSDRHAGADSNHLKLKADRLRGLVDLSNNYEGSYVCGI